MHWWDMQKGLSECTKKVEVDLPCSRDEVLTVTRGRMPSSVAYNFSCSKTFLSTFPVE